MVILCNLILIFVNLIHFYKHFKCRQTKGNNTEFGAYPVLFIMYGVFQLGLSMYLTLLYICDQDAIYEYPEHGRNSSDLITIILLYPFGQTQDFTYFVKPTPIHNILIISDNYRIYNSTIISIIMLFIIYFFEGFLHFYRFYTVYNTHKYLKNAPFNTIIKYYMIYAIVILITFLINLFFLQRYFLNLIAIFHCIFIIYCANQQIKILCDSTKESFNRQQIKLLMAPLFSTRIYSFLSIIPSILFLCIFIVSNTFNSLIYYPIFATLNTYFLSLIFARNRYFFCKCCKYKQKENSLTVITDNKSQAMPENKLRKFAFWWCLPLQCKCKKTTNKGNIQKKSSLSVNSIKDSNDSIKSEINIDFHDHQKEQENIPNSHVLLPTVANMALDDLRMNYVINKLNKLNQATLASHNMNMHINMNVNNDVEGRRVEQDEDLFDYTHVLSQNNIENNMENNHIKHVTAFNMAQNAIAPRLSSVELAQNLTLLNILTSQGLMKNPIELLHCLRKSKRTLKEKKYKKQKQKHMEMRQ